MMTCLPRVSLISCRRAFADLRSPRPDGARYISISTLTVLLQAISRLRQVERAIDLRFQFTLGLDHPVIGHGLVLRDIDDALARRLTRRPAAKVLAQAIKLATTDTGKKTFPDSARAATGGTKR